MELKDN